jgi:hypothetical protein
MKVSKASWKRRDDQVLQSLIRACLLAVGDRLVRRMASAWLLKTVSAKYRILESGR